MALTSENVSQEVDKQQVLLQSSHVEVERLTAVEVEKGAYITRLEEDVQKKQEQSARLSQELTFAQSEVAQLMTVRDEKEECLKSLQQDLKDKEASAAKLTGELQSSQDQVAGLIKVRDEKEERIKSLQQDVKDKEEALKSLQEEVQSKDQTVSTLTGELQSSREEVAGQVKVQGEQKECIKGLKQDVKNKDEAAFRLNGELHSLQDEVAGLIKVRDDKEECIKGLQEDFKEKAETISRLTGELQASQEEVDALSALTRKVASREAALQTVVSERDAMLASRDEALAEARREAGNKAEALAKASQRAAQAWASLEATTRRLHEREKQHSEALALGALASMESGITEKGSMLQTLQKDVARTAAESHAMLSAREEVVGGLRQEVGAQGQALTAAAEVIEQLRAALEETSWRLLDTETEESEIVGKLAGLEKVVTEKETSIEELRKEGGKQRAVIERRGQELRKCDEDLGSKNAESIQLRAALDEARAAVWEHAASAEAKNDEICSISASVENLARTISERDESLATRVSEMASLRVMDAKLGAKLDAICELEARGQEGTTGGILSDANSVVLVRSLGTRTVEATVEVDPGQGRGARVKLGAQATESGIPCALSDVKAELQQARASNQKLQEMLKKASAMAASADFEDDGADEDEPNPAHLPCNMSHVETVSGSEVLVVAMPLILPAGNIEKQSRSDHACPQPCLGFTSWAFGAVAKAPATAKTPDSPSSPSPAAAFLPCSTFPLPTPRSRSTFPPTPRQSQDKVGGQHVYDSDWPSMPATPRPKIETIVPDPALGLLNCLCESKVLVCDIDDTNGPAFVYVCIDCGQMHHRAANQ